MSEVYLGGACLPVNPASLRFTVPTDYESHDLLGRGEAELLKGARLFTVELAGVLPGGGIRGGGELLPPMQYAAFLRSVVELGLPIRLIYTGSLELNELCSLHDPVFVERGGTADVEYSLTLKRWVDLSLGEQSPADAYEGWQSPGEGGGGATYTVKGGDTLSYIARCLLGDSSRWRELYALNRELIKNPNLIYPGMVLALPEDASGTVGARRRRRTGEQVAAQSVPKTLDPGDFVGTYGQSVPSGGIVTNQGLPVYDR